MLRGELLEARDLDVPDLIELQQPLSPCKHVTQEGHAAFAEWGQVELSFLQSRLAKELTYIAEDGEQVLLGRDLVLDRGAVDSMALRRGLRLVGWGLRLGRLLMGLMWRRLVCVLVWWLRLRLRRLLWRRLRGLVGRLPVSIPCGLS